MSEQGMNQAVHTACQSCGMPMHEEAVYGTEADGSRTAEFCLYCYEGGAFKQPELTLQGMVEICVPFLVEEGMPAEQARAHLEGQLPLLRRWSAVPKV